MIAGELYDEHGKPIAAVIDATPASRNGSGGSGGGARLGLAPVATPGPRPLTLPKIPTWGWVAIAAAVGLGAYAVFGDDVGGSDEYDDEDLDDVDVDEPGSIVAA